MKSREQIQAELAEPFPPDAVKWKPQMVKDNRAMAVAYIDPRMVMKRLDAVLGFDGWEESYRDAPGGNVVCTLRVRTCEGTWVQKEGIGTPSGQPDVSDRAKAAFSEALKLAAVKLGIGRYLYDLPKEWVDYDPAKKQLVRRPELPAWAVPDDFKAAGPKMADTVAKLALAYCNESKRHVADYTAALLGQLGYRDTKISVAAIQLRHAKAMTRKINADMEEWATGRLPDGYPKTGPELHKRVVAKDTELAKQHPKHVAVGALLAAVVEAGVKSGLSSDLTKWEGNKAMRVGYDAVAAFLAATNVKTGQAAPEQPPPQNQQKPPDATDGRAEAQGDGGDGDYPGDYAGDDYE